jgi:hypothetical protein
METINKQATSNPASEQGASSAPQRQGGFVQGAAVTQGCCGEPGSSGGCCGASAQTMVPAATIQPAAQAGCCGTPAAQTRGVSSSSCCG